MKFNPAVADEMSALNSIYEPNTLSIATVQPSDSPSDERVKLSLILPTVPLTFALSLPPSYPESSPPEVLSPCTAVGDCLSKGAGNRAVEVARRVIQRVWSGEVCLYDFVEELERILKEDPAFQLAPTKGAPADPRDEEPSAPTPTQPPGQTPSFEPSWVVDEPATVHHSVFQARACAVSSAPEAAAAVAALRAIEGKLARATHHIWAYRLASPNGAGPVMRDCDDDGERAAGAKVLGVLEAMKADGVLVIVSRWFGGTLLGPERFRIIARCARGVVVRGGWGNQEGRDR